MAIARAEKQEMAQREADRRASINDMHVIQDQQRAEAEQVEAEKKAVKVRSTLPNVEPRARAKPRTLRIRAES